jgi:hypothetical protein
LDYAGVAIQTNTVPQLIMTVMVEPDSSCVVSDTYPVACDDTHNNTINLAGGTDLYLAGVQYAPSDNVVMSGSSSGNGYVGQIVSWTIRYTGNSTLNQQGPGTEGNGILRIDAACSAPAEPCNP